MQSETFSTRTTDSPPPSGEEYRLLYADHVPVQEWQAVYGTFEEIKDAAIKQAARDLRPSSGVFDNVFIVERYVDDEWDGYDDEGEDLSDLVFEGWMPDPA